MEEQRSKAAPIIPPNPALCKTGVGGISRKERHAPGTFPGKRVAFTLPIASNDGIIGLREFSLGSSCVGESRL